MNDIFGPVQVMLGGVRFDDGADRIVRGGQRPLPASPFPGLRTAQRRQWASCRYSDFVQPYSPIEMGTFVGPTIVLRQSAANGIHPHLRRPVAVDSPHREGFLDGILPRSGGCVSRAGLLILRSVGRGFRWWWAYVGCGWPFTFDEAATVVEFQRGDIAAMQKLVGEYFEVVDGVSPAVIWLSETGKIDGSPMNRRGTMFLWAADSNWRGQDVLMGDVLITGLPDE
jgi:hypothetical protein